MIFPEGSLVLLIGPPASGKSTLAAQLVSAGEVAAEDVLSTDVYRQQLRGDALDLRSDRKVWTQVREQLDERMAAGRTTVIDATNIFPRRRARHIRVARTHGRAVIAVRFDVDAAELAARNEARSPSVRPDVILTLAVDMDREGTAEALAAEDIDTVLEAAEVRRRLAGDD